MCRSIFLLMLVHAAFAQDPPPAAATPAQPAPVVLEYTGKPLTVPFQCTPDDMQWAGMSCTEDDPCPVYLELTSVESVGTKIFAAGNIHAAAVTLYSMLLGSEDSGRTWREAHTRIRGAGLDHVQFFDADTGWVSGQTLFPLPQDPFLLVTTDGGKTWRQRAVFSDSRESRYGSIQQFFFSAKDTGSLIVDRGSGGDGDRYELYESPNGGETWIIKETGTKPPRLKRVAPAGSWRARADRTQAYQIEQQRSERWTSAAAFSAKLGVCKPAPQTGEEPPPVVEPPDPPKPPVGKKKKK